MGRLNFFVYLFAFRMIYRTFGWR